MDRIVKNDRIMGVLALLTFAMVAWMCYDKFKTQKSVAE